MVPQMDSIEENFDIHVILLWKAKIVPLMLISFVLKFKQIPVMHLRLCSKSSEF